MNKLVMASVLASTLLVAGEAGADPILRAGPSVDVGFPSGLSAGVVASPGLLPWLQARAGLSYNLLAPGLYLGVLADPFRSNVGLTLGADVGGFYPGSIPGAKNSPDVSYVYESIELGLRIGNRNGFNFYLRGGAAHTDLSASNFTKSFTLPAGVSVGDPSASVWAPEARLGVQWLF